MTWRENAAGAVELEQALADAVRRDLKRQGVELELAPASGGFVVPVLDGRARSLFERHVWRWHELAREHGARAGVPPHWILGVIYAESLGDPLARSPVGAIGLMQLYSSDARQGYAPALLTDPELNVRLGADYLAKLARSPNSPDLPRVASRYNAGQRTDGTPHPSSSSAWGMREQHGYIGRVVAAANWALGKLRETYAETGTSSSWTTLALTVTVLRWLL